MPGTPSTRSAWNSSKTPRLARLLDKFQPVAPGILGVEAACAGNRLIVHYDTALRERFPQCVEIGYGESRVRLLAGRNPVPRRCATADPRTRTSSLRGRAVRRAFRSPADRARRHRIRAQLPRILRVPRSEYGRPGNARRHGASVARPGRWEEWTDIELTSPPGRRTLRFQTWPPTYSRRSCGCAARASAGAGDDRPHQRLDPELRKLADAGSRGRLDCGDDRRRLRRSRGLAIGKRK